MCPKLPLLSMHTDTRPQGSPWCDKPDKKLEKNLDPPIINPKIRDSSLIFATKSNLSNCCEKYVEYLIIQNTNSKIFINHIL